MAFPAKCTANDYCTNPAIGYGFDNLFTFQCVKNYPFYVNFWTSLSPLVIRVRGGFRGSAPGARPSYFCRKRGVLDFCRHRAPNCVWTPRHRRFSSLEMLEPPLLKIPGSASESGFHGGFQSQYFTLLLLCSLFVKVDIVKMIT